MSDDAIVAALQRERAAYEQFGRKDRVAAVDAELKRLGVEVEKSEAPKVSRSTAPQGRRSKPSETA